MAQIFLSYARRDTSVFAKRLREELEKAGHSVWVDVARVGGGDFWTLEIERAIRDCPVMRDVPQAYSNRASAFAGLRNGFCTGEV
jgi:hypothetical protein